MDNPDLAYFPSALWTVLDGGLWHATGPSELARIIDDGEIRVFRTRYKNSLCKEIDAVSLFDFGPSATDRDQYKNWNNWFGTAQKSRVAIWLEIDRAGVLANILDAAEAYKLWKFDESRKLFCGVEACHKGTISVAAISSILLIDRDDKKHFQKYDMTADFIAGSLANFEGSLPPPQTENEIIQALNKGRCRAIQRSKWILR